ncbi:carbon starvation CstA family protein [Enterobacter hormaechei]
MLVGYGFVAAVLPVWLLLAPRDYLYLPENRHHRRAGDRHFDYAPTLTMPALTKFIDGTGPVWTGDLSVPVYHHRLWGGVGLPRADCLRDDAEDAGE